MTTSRLNPQLFENWLADQPPESHQILTEIREAVIASRHNFTEGIKWGSPCYWLPEISRRTIAWIQPHNDYVRLGFFNGATMPDPKNLLEGTGKKTPPHQNPPPNPPNRPPNPNNLRKRLNRPRNSRPRIPFQIDRSVPSMAATMQQLWYLIGYQVVNATRAIDKERIH